MEFIKFLNYFLIAPVLATKEHYEKGRVQTPFYYFNKMLVEALEIRFQEDDLSQKKLEGKVIYLFNHRSWADFFVHSRLCGGETSYLARSALAYLFTLNLANLFTKRLWLFDRKKKRSFSSFNEWLDLNFEVSKKYGGGDLIVYPEGHRNLKDTPLELKTGLLKYAFSRKIPMQVVICKGCDDIFNEKKMLVRKGRVLTYSFEEVFDPGLYENEGKFIEDIRESFNTSFARLYGS